MNERGAAAQILLDEAMDQWAFGRPVSALASEIRVSERTLRRRISEQLGTTPGRWQREERLRQCLVLLETTSLPIEAIASQLGLASASSLRRQVRSALGITPSEYRDRYRLAGAVTTGAAAPPNDIADERSAR